MAIDGESSLPAAIEAIDGEGAEVVGQNSEGTKTLMGEDGGAMATTSGEGQA